MYNNQLVIAVIQARGGSKGIPKKNIYPLNGHPLISYSIAAALGSKYIDELIVTTDSEEIAAVSREYGAKTPFLRPPELSGDTVVSVDSLHHAVSEAERIFGVTYGYVIELPCVSPLRDSSHVDGALEKLFSTGADSVISMANTGEKHPVRLKRITNDQITDFCKEYPEPAVGSRRQDLEPCYIRNGAIYSMTRDCLINKHSRHGQDSRPYEMPEEKSVNIDTKFDLLMADMLIREGFSNNKPVKVSAASVEVYEKPGKPRILVTCPLHFLPEQKERFKNETNCVIAANASRERVIELLRDGVTAWVCAPSPVYMIDQSVLKGLPNLKIIATPSTGSNHIDVKYCEANGIKVIALKGTDFVNTIYASSEYTFSLMLALIRNIPAAAGAAKVGEWRNVEDRFRGHELGVLTLGIVGFGRIGSNLAKFAGPFVKRICAFDPNVAIKDPKVEQFKSPMEFLPDCDVVAICVHLDDSTQGMVNQEWFDRMKTGVYFINTSRGEIIDEAALLAGLKSGKIKAAALDVMTNEQNPDKIDHPVVRYAKTNENMILTPHIAGLTYESEGKAANYTLNMVLAALGEGK